ncbi:MAG: hypothetical protein OHK0048_08520 [Rhodoferax sp.]
MLAKILILTALALILASLFSALLLLFRKPSRENSKQIAQALTLRIMLSVLLFLILVASFYTGLITGRAG